MNLILMILKNRMKMLKTYNIIFFFEYYGIGYDATHILFLFLIYILLYEIQKLKFKIRKDVLL